MPAYKDEKTGTWFCKFYYTDYNGEKKQKKKRGFKTQREAKAWERNFLETKALDVNIKFKNFVEVYLEDSRTRLKPYTIYKKEDRIKKMILPYFENMILSEIKPIHIRQWHNKLMEHRCANGEPYAQSTLMIIHGTLSSIFNYAVRYYNLAENPCAKAGSIGSKKTDVDFWTLAEFNQFITTIEDQNEYYTAYNVLYYTGMRVGELLALTWGDIDLDNNIIHITKSMQRIHKQNIITSPKTPKSVRDIVVFEYLTDIIKDYKQKIYKPKNSDNVFTLKRGQLRYTMCKAADSAKVKHIRIHDLRHSHASLLIEMGIPPLLIAERLGHENVQVTLNVYSHLYPNKHNELAEKLQCLVSNTVPK